MASMMLLSRKGADWVRGEIEASQLGRPIGCHERSRWEFGIESEKLPVYKGTRGCPIKGMGLRGKS